MHKGSYLYSEGFFPLIRYMLFTNIVCGDAINEAQNIVFTDYKVEGKSFEQRRYVYSDLGDKSPQPIEVIPKRHYLGIGMDYQSKTGCDDERIQRHFNLI